MQTQLERQRDIAGAILAALPHQVIAPRRIDGLVHPDRLAIHARNMRASLVSALGSIFPASQRVTGHGFFAYACSQFISAQPPRDPVVDGYGAELPGFLASFAPAGHLAWLPDLARLEWQMHELACAMPPAPHSTLVPPDAPDMTVIFTASSALFASDWPIDHIRTAAELSTIDMAAPSLLLLWAEEDGVALRRLDAGEYAFVESLRDHQPLSRAMAAAISLDPDFDAATELRRLFAAGCISALHPHYGDTP